MEPVHQVLLTAHLPQPHMPRYEMLPAPRMPARIISSFPYRHRQDRFWPPLPAGTRSPPALADGWSVCTAERTVTGARECQNQRKPTTWTMHGSLSHHHSHQEPARSTSIITTAIPKTAHRYKGFLPPIGGVL